VSPSVSPSGTADPVSWAVESSMYRALAVLRVVVLLNAIGLGWYRREPLDHPVVQG